MLFPTLSGLAHGARCLPLTAFCLLPQSGAGKPGACVPVGKHVAFFSLRKGCRLPETAGRATIGSTVTSRARSRQDLTWEFEMAESKCGPRVWAAEKTLLTEEESMFQAGARVRGKRDRPARRADGPGGCVQARVTGAVLRARIHGNRRSGSLRRQRRHVFPGDSRHRGVFAR